jgi:hypothetical protein
MVVGCANQIFKLCLMYTCNRSKYNGTMCPCCFSLYYVSLLFWFILCIMENLAKCCPPQTCTIGETRLNVDSMYMHSNETLI